MRSSRFTSGESQSPTASHQPGLRRGGCAIQVTDVGPCAVPTFAATVHASVSNRRLFEAGSKGVDLRSNGDKLRSQRGGKPTIRKRY